ncbi:phosphoribosyltransferase family protein [Undibacterium sp.]|uniref:phosphoribosyltransferase family protein n=1 Tax=Undibacterium sp. TaxID=1914977 RepID=UPI002CD40B44|nr:phosphoribosyltransferase family protein [Undibacterium sp.]HTD06068.1 phosphoribosyltransferase family protein [Undibacterium sp.]
MLAKLSTLLPSACALCGEHGRQVLCAACHGRFLSARQQRCVQCALPVPESAAQARCGACLKEAPSFDHTVAACNYAAPLDQLVLNLKFGHQLALAPVFSLMLRDAILEQRSIPLPDMLAMVPLGKRRLAERGFNQALEIAKPLAGHLGIPLMPQLLNRGRETAQQSGLHPDDRHKNVRHAFMLAPDALDSVKGRHIGIVDDVMTTGTTLNEIAGMLKRFGAAKVSNYVFARTLPH